MAYTPPKPPTPPGRPKSLSLGPDGLPLGAPPLLSGVNPVQPSLQAQVPPPLPAWSDDSAPLMLPHKAPPLYHMEEPAAPGASVQRQRVSSMGNVGALALPPSPRGRVKSAGMGSDKPHAPTYPKGAPTPTSILFAAPPRPYLSREVVSLSAHVSSQRPPAIAVAPPPVFYDSKLRINIAMEKLLKIIDEDTSNIVGKLTRVEEHYASNAFIFKSFEADGASPFYDEAPYSGIIVMYLLTLLYRCKSHVDSRPEFYENYKKMLFKILQELWNHDQITKMRQSYELAKKDAPGLPKIYLKVLDNIHDIVSKLPQELSINRPLLFAIYLGDVKVIEDIFEVLKKHGKLTTNRYTSTPDGRVMCDRKFAVHPDGSAVLAHELQFGEPDDVFYEVCTLLNEMTKRASPGDMVKLAKYQETILELLVKHGFASKQNFSVFPLNLTPVMRAKYDKFRKIYGDEKA